MFVTCNRITVNPDHAEAFEKRFADRASLVDTMPGFVSFQLLRPQTAGDPYVVMTHWESEAHFKAWTESDAFKEGHARSGSLPRETFAGQPKMEMFEVIQSTKK
jgi:heme-degrading monooxygenase HmoA